MVGPVLPVNVDSTYADSGTDPSVAAHQQHHDAIHAILNKIDTALGSATTGQVLAWNGTVYAPLDLQLATTPMELRAASGGTGAYPARPATPRPVYFLGANDPGGGGSFGGGGGMVANWDSWFQWTAL